jgi:hypothetical protein
MFNQERSNFMKKILSIILAILMLVTMIPFTPIAFAAESGFTITHQPTVDEFYVETNNANATYQWYGEKSAYEIDDTYASPYKVNDNTDLSYYDDVSGWTPSYSHNGQFNLYVMKFFKIEFQNRETVTFEFSSDEIKFS